MQRCYSKRAVRWKLSSSAVTGFALHRLNERRFVRLRIGWRFIPLRETTLSVSDPQHVFPLAKVTVEAHTLGDLECRK